MSHEWITPRIREIPPSGIRSFFDRGNDGRNTISLGLGEPDFITPERVRAACIRALNEGKTMYTPNAGLMELREEIASYLNNSFQINYEPSSEILVTVGSSEALDLALRAVVALDDEVIIPSPGYVAYSPLIHMNGGKVVEVETSAEQRFKLTSQALRDRITPRSKVLLVNYPSNPTGAIMSYEDWQPIAEIVKANNLIVISDEVYAELTYSRQHTSIASLPGMKERTIVISGFSKAFAMTGWRIGYACGNQELIAGMLKIHQYTAMCAPIIGQIAAIESLRHGLEEKDRMKETFNQRRQMFVQGLRDIGLPCHEPQGALYAFPSIAHTGLRSEQFALRLLEKAGVAAVPGHVFGSGGEGFIRCSYATSLSKLTEALERIERFLTSTTVKTFPWQAG
ncbi:aminotransferase class I/II-fold pyridoxal phosphate-dependent enzyme [Cohnella silvisoli]|uniref:Aminotransferase n=1 Tax=Cohnella silvisoli TaxID=2873699 RepID=A0ABV1KZW3_9BACL|nr:aminotransferase class I/II-fold pyridoxal phosphate-dependent enzyme [Cohnella silvisoli]MCD9025006.1 aminotransferase class I/II-fold pyridoxal phosphate-dependent enzyme [Cohnella silvisoli]